MSEFDTTVNPSRFAMWRAVLALAHADGVITPEEMDFIVQTMREIPFTNHQRQILQQDLEDVPDISQLFKSITDPQDQQDFFRYGQDIVMVDGDFAAEEEKMLKKLRLDHLDKETEQQVRKTMRDVMLDYQEKAQSNTTTTHGAIADTSEQTGRRPVMYVVQAMREREKDGGDEVDQER